MLLFLSWASVTTAENVYNATRIDGDAEQQVAAAASLAVVVPEYVAYLRERENYSKNQLEKGETVTVLPSRDEFNDDLLSVRCVFTQKDLQSSGERRKERAYSLHKRMPYHSSLPVSLAFRNFLVTTFPGNWSGRLDIPGHDKITFVGYGLSEFFRRFAMACAAAGKPLPVDMYCHAKFVEMTDLDKSPTSLMLACASQPGISEEDKQGYTRISDNWKGVGVSADRALDLTLTTAAKLGLYVPAIAQESAPA